MCLGCGIGWLCRIATKVLLAYSFIQWSVQSIEAESAGNPIVEYGLKPTNEGRSMQYETGNRQERVTAVSFPLYGSVSSTAYWFADVFLGFPTPQRQSLIVDTGSSVTAFPCLDCKARCGKHLDVPFNISQGAVGINCVPSCLLCARTISATARDQTFNPRGGQDTQVLEGQCAYNIKYTEGSSLIGRWFEDHVWLKDTGSVQNNLESDELGSPSSSRFPFGCHSEETHLFLNQEASGIMGLEVDNPYGPQPFVVSTLKELMKGRRSSPSLAAAGIEDLRSQSINLRDTSQPQPRVLFSMCLSNSGGILTIGGTNEKFHVTPRTASPGSVTTHPFESGWKEQQRTVDGQGLFTAVLNDNHPPTNTSPAGAQATLPASANPATSGSQYSIRSEFSYELPPPLSFDASAFLRYQDAALGVPKQQQPRDYDRGADNPSAVASQAHTDNVVTGINSFNSPQYSAPYSAQYPAQYTVPQLTSNSNRMYIPVKQYIASQQPSTPVQPPVPSASSFDVGSPLMQQDHASQYNQDPQISLRSSPQVGNLAFQPPRDFSNQFGSNAPNPLLVNSRRYQDPTPYIASQVPQVSREYPAGTASTLNITPRTRSSVSMFPGSIASRTIGPSANDFVFRPAEVPKAGSVSGLRISELAASSPSVTKLNIAPVQGTRSNAFQWQLGGSYPRHNVGFNPSISMQRGTASGLESSESVSSIAHPGSFSFLGSSQVGSIVTEVESSSRRRPQASRRPRILQDSPSSDFDRHSEGVLGLNSSEDATAAAYYPITAETGPSPTPLIEGFEGNYLTFVERIIVLGATQQEHDISLPLSRRSPAGARARHSSLQVGLLSLADSGTTLTYLPLLVYSSLWASIMKNILAAKEKLGAPVFAAAATDSGSYRRLGTDRTIRSSEVIRLSGRPANYLQRRVRSFERRLQRRAKTRTLETDIYETEIALYGEECTADRNHTLANGNNDASSSRREYCGSSASELDDAEAENDLIRIRALATAKQVLQELEEVETALENDERVTADVLGETGVIEDEDLMCAPARILVPSSRKNAETTAARLKSAVSPQDGTGGTNQFGDGCGGLEPSRSATTLVRNTNYPGAGKEHFAGGRTVNSVTATRRLGQHVYTLDNSDNSETINDGNQHKQHTQHKQQLNSAAAGSDSVPVFDSLFSHVPGTDDAHHNGGVRRCPRNTGICSNNTNILGGVRWVDTPGQGEAAESKVTTSMKSKATAFDLSFREHIEGARELLPRGNIGMSREVLEEVATAESSGAAYSEDGVVDDSEYFSYFRSPVPAEYEQISASATPLRRLEPVAANRKGEECWHLANREKDFRYFPDIKLSFAQRVTYIWRPRSYLYQKNSSSVYCLTLVPKDDDEVLASYSSGGTDSQETTLKKRRDLGAESGDVDTAVTNQFRRQLQEDQESAILGTGFFINHDIIFDLSNWSMSFSEANCPVTDLEARRGR